MSIPVDVGYLVYFIMIYEGIGNLFPWNAFITASNYYSDRFCGSPFEDNFENFFSITYTLSQTIGLAFSVLYQNKISMHNKIVWPLACYSAVFAINTMLVGVENINSSLLFGVTLISTCLCGLCGALLSSGIFGLAAMFPPSYTAALMNGQGVAGLTVSVASILTQVSAAASDDCSDDNAGDDGSCDYTVDSSALSYFIISTIILGTCIFAFYSLSGLEYAKYYIARATAKEIRNEEIVNPFMEGHEGSEHNLVGASANTGRSIEEKTIAVMRDTDGNQDELDAEDASATLSIAKLTYVYSFLRIPSLSVFYVFTVTIGLFPSLIVLLESEKKCDNDNRFYNDLYVPFFFVLFNLFDLAGRLTAGAIPPLFTPKNIWIASAARTIFFPLFLFCNISGSKLPILFKSDAFPIIFMILMAFTNGYVASLCMMQGASSVKAKDAPIAGTIMVFSLTVGLFMGACVSFIVVLISQGSV